MKVESAGARPAASVRRSRRRAWRPAIAGVAAIAIGAAIGLAALRADRLHAGLLEASGASSDELAWRALLNAPENFVRASFARERAPRLRLDIKFKHLHKIHERRDLALAQGVLKGSPEDFVPATIETEGRRAGVKLRGYFGTAVPFHYIRWSLYNLVIGPGLTGHSGVREKES